MWRIFLLILDCGNSRSSVSPLYNFKSGKMPLLLYGKSTFTMSSNSQNIPLDLLDNWAKASETYWSTIPGHPEWGVYGTGYNGWGVQTTQTYLAAMAALAHYGNGVPGIDIEWAKDRALAALRFNLASHKSGDFHCTDNTQWGHTWISALGIERMMFGVHLLRPHFSDQDEESLQRVLVSEANWLLTDYHRGKEIGIKANQWASDGGNDPESNIWNGALLWRVSQMYPFHQNVAAWQERAHCFLINGVSIPDDAQNMKIIAGKPISERFIGANFFPNYALDHHGYLNVGYITICISNAAMLHFDLKLAGLNRPESLDHHQADLWKVLRRMIFSDGRLARIGGDTRVRYAYCQEYLLPALLYAADQFNDGHALDLIKSQLTLIQQEADDAGDGSFYGNRLDKLKKHSLHYYTRLESDRACALGMLLAYRELVESPEEPQQSFENSVRGNWCEPEHGAALHRSETRFASSSWRASGLAQGLCLPPDDGHLAEWENNLAGKVEFANHPQDTKTHRRLENYHIDEFDGGFVTCGSIIEGVDISIAEGWKATDSAIHQIAFAALPDNHTVIGLQHCRMNDRRGYVAQIKGMQFNLPNDLYNNYQRELFTVSGKSTFTSPSPQEECISLDSKWANIENRIGLVGLYGADNLAIHRHPERRAGALQSLFVEEICFPGITETTLFEAGEIILDVGWTVLSSVDADTTKYFCKAHQKVLLDTEFEDVRAVRIKAADQNEYIMIANFSAVKVLLPITTFSDNMHLIDLTSRTQYSDENKIAMEPGQAKALKVLFI